MDLITEAKRKQAKKREAPVWWIGYSMFPGHELSYQKQFRTFDAAFRHLWKTSLKDFHDHGPLPMTYTKTRAYLLKHWANRICTPEGLSYHIDYYFPSDSASSD